jgi:putative ABC transport system permease protein
MVMIIVMLITVMLIGDSKKLAAILKSLGYYDKENAASFLSIYVPVILLGLLLSIPLSFALIYAFQAIIFTGGGILLLANVK